MEIPVRQTNSVQMGTADMENGEVQTAEEKLLEFIQEQISKFSKYSTLGLPGELPGFYRLNEALTQWGFVNSSLVSMDALAKIELQKAKKAYDNWYDAKYIEARKILNPLELAATKWASSKEIECYLRSTWNSEYEKLSDAVNACEIKVAFIRRMLDGWNSQLLALNRLSRNVEAETVKLGGSLVGD